LSVLIDTSAWVEALRNDGDPAVQSQVKHLLQTGEAATCSMIMLELWNGARGEYERSQLGRFAESLTFLAIDDAAWRESWNLATTARSIGITIPSTDLLIIAVASYHSAELIHCDRHFAMYLDSVQDL
jgi:predicted nucleic acid-binding protein